MPPILAHILRCLAPAAVAVGLGMGPARAQQATCYEWSEAAPIVAREKLVSAAEIHVKARAARMGELIRITLCEEGGRYVYRLVLQQPGGKVQNLTVDARRPFPR